MSFLITFYCACVLCCGPWSDGFSRSGRYATQGITAACPPRLYGKVIFIEGIGTRWCEDTGSAIKGNRIDVFVDSHSEALEHGVKQASILVLGDWKNEKVTIAVDSTGRLRWESGKPEPTPARSNSTRTAEATEAK